MFSGDKGEITITTMLAKKNGNWQVIKAGYIDRAGNCIDIMEPYGRGKKQETGNYIKSTEPERFV